MKEASPAVYSSKIQLYFFCFLLCLLASPIIAQNSQDSQQQEPLSLLPEQVNLYYQPNQLSTQYVRVTNQTDLTHSYQVKYDTSWIFIFPQSFSLQPGESKEIITGFVFPEAVSKLSEKSNTITFESRDNQTSNHLILRVSVPQQPQNQQQSRIPQPQVNNRQPELELEEYREQTPENTIEILPDSILIVYGNQQLYVRDVNVVNWYNYPVSVSANYDTSWIVTFPKTFKLAPEERRTVRTIFIGTKLTPYDTTKSDRIDFILKRSGENFPLSIQVRPPKPIAQVQPQPVQPKPAPQKTASNQNQSAGTTEKTNSGGDQQKNGDGGQTINTAQQAFEHLEEIYTVLKNTLDEEINNQDVSLNLEQTRLIITIAGHNSFDVGDLYPKDVASEYLGSIGSVLRRNLVESMVVFVYGNTDTLPIIRPVNVNSNWDLSAVRASSVVNFLQNMVGIDGHYMIAIGRSSYSPVATNKTPQGRTANRRIELVVTFKPYVKEILE